jgi:hypothetical protein
MRLDPAAAGGSKASVAPKFINVRFGSFASVLPCPLLVRERPCAWQPIGRTHDSTSAGRPQPPRFHLCLKILEHPQGAKYWGAAITAAGRWLPFLPGYGVSPRMDRETSFRIWPVNSGQTSGIRPAELARAGPARICAGELKWLYLVHVHRRTVRLSKRPQSWRPS